MSIVLKGLAPDGRLRPVRINEAGSLIMEAEGAGFSFSTDQELYISETERERNVRAHYRLSGVQASAWALLVDLSDTVNWPHDDTGRIDISLINAMVDRSANSVGQMQLGVITRLSATNGDVTVIAALAFENNSETHIARDINLSPSQVKCGVDGDGNTPYMVTNARVLNDTGLQNDTAIASAIGTNVIPAVGDIVLRFLHTSGGVWTGSCGVLYHAEDHV